MFVKRKRVKEVGEWLLKLLFSLFLSLLLYFVTSSVSLFFSLWDFLFLGLAEGLLGFRSYSLCSVLLHMRGGKV